jgi:FG-GAP-like repeat
MRNTWLFRLSVAALCAVLSALTGGSAVASCSLSSPSIITRGQSATLSWSSTPPVAPPNCSPGSGFISGGIGNVGESGSRTVSPILTTTYNGTFFFQGPGFFGCGPTNPAVCKTTILIDPFGTPGFSLSAFGVGAGGWTSNDLYPRVVADVNGDGMADIVGFGYNGVYVSLATGGGNFAPPVLVLSAFGVGAGGWTSNDTYPRVLADVNGDGMADIVGFGFAGIYVSLATGGGNFAPPVLVLSAFGVGAGNWTSNDAYPRVLADVNGDGMADIVGFGSAGVYVSLATGGGGFAQPVFVLDGFGPGGGWTSNDTNPRLLGDVNGDGRADILGFAFNGVYLSLATGGGNFAAPVLALAAFGNANAVGGWTSNDLYPRVVVDVNGDGRADVVGFGSSGVYIAFATGGGNFSPPQLVLRAFGVGAGGWSSNDTYPRRLGNVNGDATADAVGFSSNGVYVSTLP